MSQEANKSLIRSFVEEVFNNHDLSAIEKYFMKDNPPKTTEEFKKSLSNQFTAFPDIQVKIEHMVAENDFVVVFLNFSATHKREFKGILPTNKKINIRSADLYRLKNEKIIEHWDVVDQLNLVRQIGITL